MALLISLPLKKPHTVGVKRLEIRSVIGWCMGKYWEKQKFIFTLKSVFCKEPLALQYFLVEDNASPSSFETILSVA